MHTKGAGTEKATGAGMPVSGQGLCPLGKSSSDKSLVLWEELL